MYKTFDEMINCCGCLGGSNVVAASADRETVEAMKLAFGHGLGRAVLVGDEAVLRPAMEEFGVAERAQLVHADTPARPCAGPSRSCARAGPHADEGARQHGGLPARSARQGERAAHRAHTEPSRRARDTGRASSSFCADSGFIIAPTLKEKKYIIANSLRAIHALGYEHVNVAILAANERVNPDMPATVDAAALVEAWRAGEFDGLPCTCTIEGPMAIDVVASKEAAERKGIRSVIAGKVDLTIVPSIECGNVHCKTLIHYCHAKSAGVVLGAKAPIILVSRTDDHETKFNAIALSCLVAGGMHRC